MKKIIFLILLPLAVCSFWSCTKSTDPEISNAIQQAKTDDAAIQAYLTAHPEITNVKDTLGCYYQITSQGTGPYPTLSSTIHVSYTGSLLNGTSFETNNDFSAVLGTLIYGWQIVLPHVPTGSKVLMFIPSIYGYGTSGTSTIPANSVLVFNINTAAPGA
ncbi:FKBP-type peptidyl-prolyl cis-trans isomerase [Mucilaginibacter flavus]|uniref:FKBP-type peptidyl-prolyl cis-trans isomerase n=1 Tax=Mucilaginibacter flavus TaxID=931504 RepID=UPI0025B4E6CF|nr:FKBP-type peptidyl-prolyl cis-trans isomerase [Mucilaginibacter flavus]MDN3582328.1 FKBP-type peptidyl-prolyl cis-trans isomerase [Mucilaginibacter flavus]